MLTISLLLNCWLIIHGLLQEHIMSMAFGFCTASDDQLENIINGNIDLHEMRWNTDNQYENFIQESFEFYSMEVLEILGSGDYPLSNLLFLAKEDKEFYEAQEGLLYDSDAVTQIVSDFQETDLNEVVSDMGYAEDQDVINLFQKVQKLFEFANEKDINVIGFII